MLESWLDKKLKKIQPRDWNELIVRWQNHIPSFDPAGGPPLHSLAELSILHPALSRIDNENLVEIPDESMLGVRETLLHEAVYLLHKAAHVVACAGIHVDHGMSTWSLSAAYQAAIFANAAIARFLGVAYLEANNRHFIIDVWASEWKQRKRRRGRSFPLAMNVKRVEQRHSWAIIQRLVETTVNGESAWNQGVRGQVLALSHTDFARQRNQLHYRPSGWIRADLHSVQVDAAFGRARPQDRRLHDAFRPDADDFTALLSTTLTRAAHKMLQQLSVTDVGLQAELAMIDTWFATQATAIYDDVATWW